MRLHSLPPQSGVAGAGAAVASPENRGCEIECGRLADGVSYRASFEGAVNDLALLLDIT